MKSNIGKEEINENSNSNPEPIKELLTQQKARDSKLYAHFFCPITHNLILEPIWLIPGKVAAERSTVAQYQQDWINNWIKNWKARWDKDNPGVPYPDPLPQPPIPVHPIDATLELPKILPLPDEKLKKEIENFLKANPTLVAEWNIPIPIELMNEFKKIIVTEDINALLAYLEKHYIFCLKQLDDYGKKTVLQLATLSGKIEIVKIIIEKIKSNDEKYQNHYLPNFILLPEQNGLNALQLAAIHQQIEIVNYLLLELGWPNDNKFTVKFALNSHVIFDPVWLIKDQKICCEKATLEKYLKEAEKVGIKVLIEFNALQPASLIKSKIESLLKQSPKKNIPEETRLKAYDLVLILEKEKEEEEEEEEEEEKFPGPLEPEKLYIRVQDNKLLYAVITPAGIPEIDQPLEGIELKAVTFEELQNNKAKILEITSNKGHTFLKKREELIDKIIVHEAIQLQFKQVMQENNLEALAHFLEKNPALCFITFEFLNGQSIIHFACKLINLPDYVQLIKNILKSVHNWENKLEIWATLKDQYGVSALSYLYAVMDTPLFSDFNQPSLKGKSQSFSGNWSQHWLINAIAEGNLNFIKSCFLFKPPPAINGLLKVYKKPITPLCFSIMKGNIAVVKMIVGMGGDIHTPDNEGVTPLHLAAELGYLTIVEYLISNGADVNRLDNQGNTVLLRAFIGGVKYKNTGVIHHLFKNALNYKINFMIKNINQDGIFHFATEINDSDILTKLIAMDIFHPKFFFEPNKQFYNPVHHLLINKNDKILSTVLSSKSFISIDFENWKNPKDWTQNAKTLNWMAHVLIKKNQFLQKVFLLFITDINQSFRYQKQEKTLLSIAIENHLLGEGYFLLQRGATITPDFLLLLNTPVNYYNIKTIISVIHIIFEKHPELIEKLFNDAVIQKIYSVLTTISILDKYKTKNLQESTITASSLKKLLESDINILKPLLLHTGNNAQEIIFYLIEMNEKSLLQFILRTNFHLFNIIAFKDTNKNNILHKVATTNNAHIMELLLKDDQYFLLTHLNATNDYGEIPLHIAAESGNTQVLKVLIDYGSAIDIQARDKQNRTPLQLACRYGHLKIVDILINNKADIQILDNSGNSCLHLACWFGHWDIAKALILHSKKPVLSFLGTVFSKDSLNFINKTNHLGETPLYLTARFILEISTEGNKLLLDRAEKALVFLLDQGAKLNISSGENIILDYCGEESYQRCIREHFINSIKNKSVKPLEYYLKLGLNIHALFVDEDRNVDNMTVLHYAAQYHQSSLVKELIKSGCNIHAKNTAWQTPMHLACMTSIRASNLETIHLLLSENPLDSLNAISRILKTPLHYAVEYGEEPIVKLLLEYGANPHLKDREGITPLDVARKLNFYKVLPILEFAINNNSTILISKKLPPLYAIKEFPVKGTFMLAFNIIYQTLQKTNLDLKNLFEKEAADMEKTITLLEKDYDPKLHKNAHSIIDKLRKNNNYSNMHIYPIFQKNINLINEQLVCLNDECNKNSKYSFLCLHLQNVLNKLTQFSTNSMIICKTNQLNDFFNAMKRLNGIVLRIDPRDMVSEQEVENLFTTHWIFAQDLEAPTDEIFKTVENFFVNKKDINAIPNQQI